MVRSLVNRLRDNVASVGMAPIARRVRSERLTYLSPAKLKRIMQILDAVDREGLEGAIVEFGVALGGSAILMASLLDGRRRFIGYDVFATIPPPSERDGADAHERYRVIASGRSKGIAGDPYYGYQENLLDVVTRHFREFGLEVDGERVQLIPGLFEATVPSTLPAAVAFAHVDCDWYDPVTFCLEQLAGALVPGGYIILDDYNDYGGCRDATDRFLATHCDFAKLHDRPSALLRKRD